MFVQTSSVLFRPLQQLAQRWNQKYVLKEIDAQIDSYIRNNNVLIADFQARVRALEGGTTSSISVDVPSSTAVDVTSSTADAVQRFKQFVQDCHELNEKLDGLVSQIKRQDADATIEMVQVEVWPVVLDMARRHEQETGGAPCSLLSDLVKLGLFVERYVDLISGKAVNHFYRWKIDWDEKSDVNERNRRKRVEFRAACQFLFFLAISLGLQASWSNYKHQSAMQMPALPAPQAVSSRLSQTLK